MRILRTQGLVPYSFKDVPFERVKKTFFLPGADKEHPENILIASVLPLRGTPRRRENWLMTFVDVVDSIRGDGTYEVRLKLWDTEGTYLGLTREAGYNPATETGSFYIHIYDS